MRALIVTVLMLVVLSSAVKATESSAKDSTRFTGFAIALAWPKAWAKEAGEGYDRLLRGLGFNNGGFYRVGHAALVLVDGADGSCYYFDFGRYHAPAGTGRTRDAVTDHELAISTNAIIEGKRIKNFDDILCEVHLNPSTHSSGPMYASYVRINFEKARTAAKELQEKGMLPYGPFAKDGSNCSRFVRKIVLAGKPNWAHALRLIVVPMISPSALYPVSALYHWTKVPGDLDMNAEKEKDWISALPDSLFEGVLPQSKRPTNVPENAQWFAGEMAGSWYSFEQVDQELVLQRFSSLGSLECSVRMLQTEGPVFDGSGSFELTYPSHCKEVNMIRNGENLRFQTYTDH